MLNIKDLLRDKRRLIKIPFKIYKYSSYASSYSPNNILVDTPSDVNLRWSTTTNDHRQFLILEYEPSIVATVTFGKFNKIHVCNIREMKISVSYDNLTWIEVFYGGLKNDTTNETHNILYYKNEYIISKYMKIEPLAAWGMNFNYSIWFVELKGVIDPIFQEIVNDRQRINDIKIYKSILKKYSKEILNKEDIIEHYINNNLYEELEEYIKNLDLTKFNNFVKKSKYFGEWKEIYKNTEEWPCPRGGHQLAATSKGIYLYGGWDGTEELGDMWLYNGKWTCLLKDCNKIVNNHSLINNNIEDLIKNNINDVMNYENTPGKRSCHKMCTDGEKLFLTGKYIPTTDRSGDIDDSELWVFDNDWSIYKNTGDVSSNMYDHYLVHANNEIFMFGGKTTNFDDKFGGLYKINIDNKNNTVNWSKLLDSTNQSGDSPILKGRLGHVLLYINTPDYPNTLAIIGGQRGKEYFKCIQLYSLDTSTVYESIQFPITTDGRVLQRSVLYKNDILVLFTYGKDKESRLDLSKLYSYSLIFKEWNEIELDSEGPMPRTAHQFIFWNDKFYLFGGNVVDTRQCDFWSLSLKKMNNDEAKCLAIMSVRKHFFLYLYKKDPSLGLEYLRSKVLECVIDKNTKKIFEDACYEIFQQVSDPYDDISQYINK